MLLKNEPVVIIRRADLVVVVRTGISTVAHADKVARADFAARARRDFGVDELCPASNAISGWVKTQGVDAEVVQFCMPVSIISYHHIQL